MELIRCNKDFSCILFDLTLVSASRSNKLVYASLAEAGEAPFRSHVTEGKVVDSGGAIPTAAAYHAAGIGFLLVNYIADFLNLSYLETHDHIEFEMGENSLGFMDHIGIKEKNTGGNYSLEVSVKIKSCEPADKFRKLLIDCERVCSAYKAITGFSTISLHFVISERETFGKS